MIQTDLMNELEYPTMVLSTKYHKHIGIINNIDVETIDVKNNLMSANELSFDVYKELDDNECSVWDSIVTFKYIYVPEYEEYFEIVVSADEDNATVKHIVGTSACEAELSTRKITLEINTESDILSDDYIPSVLYNKNNPRGSILTRALKDKAPDYTIKYVDPDIASIQRTFSVKEQDILSFFTSTLAEEYECLFIFDSVNREISVYKMENYGENTGVYISSENYASKISLSEPKDNVFNCLKLEGGDELMTATVVALNPNGTPYIYSYSDLMTSDMPSGLVSKLKSYQTLYDQNLKEFQDLTENIFQAINEELKYKSEMMPETPIPGKVDPATEIAKLKSSLTEVAVASLENLSNTSIDSAVKNMAKVIVDIRCKVEIEGKSTITDKTSYKEWTGKFTVTDTGDETKKATSTNCKIKIVDTNYEEFLYQKIQKTLDKKDSTFLSIFEIPYDEEDKTFKEELAEYCLDSLQSFKDSYQACLEILIENGVTDKNASFYGAELYKNMYQPYYNRILSIESEMVTRQNTIDAITTRKDGYLKSRQVIQNKLNFKNYIGEENWLILSHYLREDKYSNSNFISDGLDNKELNDRAKELYEMAQKELLKAKEIHPTLSADLIQLLNNDDFKPFRNKIQIGNWINLSIDDKLYKLRLIMIDIKSNTDISVEFSDAENIDGLMNDVKSLLDKTHSMAVSYDTVMRQSDNGQKAKEEISNYREIGLNSALYNIITSDNQDMVIDEHGLSCRQYDDVTQDYLPEQLRIINNTIAFTSDNWKTVRAALGKLKYSLDGEIHEDYGLNADHVIAGTVIGGDIYSENYNSGKQAGSQAAGTHIDLNNGHFSFAGGQLTYNGTSLEFNGNASGYIKSANIQMQYALTNSDQTIPDDNDWKYEITDWTTGKYLWQRTDVVGGDGKHQYGKPICVSMNNDDIRSIVRINNYYQISNSNTEPPAPDTWGEEGVIPTMTPEQPYLWNYEETIFNSGVPETVPPHIIAVLGKDGVSGKGISEIHEYFLASDKSTGVTRKNTSASDWYESEIPVLDSVKRYLWRYEKIVYTDKSTSYIEPVLISTIGKSAYEIALDNDSPYKTEKEWLDSLEGKDGNRGSIVWTTTNKFTSGTWADKGSYRIDKTQVTTLVPGDTLSVGDMIYAQSKYYPVATIDNKYVYAWSYVELQGENGDNAYVHFAYSTSANGTKDFNTSPFEGAIYMGTCSNNSSEDPTIPSAYRWQRIKGSDGLSAFEVAKNNGFTGDVDAWLASLEGSDGADGIDGARGSIIWTASKDFTKIEETSSHYPYGKYVISATNLTSNVEGDTLSIGDMAYYKSKYYVISNLHTSSKGDHYAYAETFVELKGTDGKSKYIHFAYALDAQGTGFSVTPFDGAVYLGICTNDTEEDPTEAKYYSQWQKIRGDNGANGIGIKSSSVTYQASSDGKNPPTGTWSNNIPTVNKGQFLWTKTVITYTDESMPPTTSYAIAHQGLDGQNGSDGADGKDGKDGRGISGTSIQYKASSDGKNPPTGTWSNNVPTVAQGDFLWTRTVYTFTSGDPQTVYSVGYQGTNGINGTSITTVENYYLATNKNSGVTAKTSGWNTDATTQIINKDTPYLWNYEKSKDDKGNVVSTTTPTIIGHFGINGTNGTNGISITGITEHYAVSNNNSTAPADSEWKETVQKTSLDKRYLWNYETIHYSDGSNDDTLKRVIGTYGDTGVGVSGIDITYNIGASSITPPTGTWSDKMLQPTLAKPYIWTKMIVNYTNGNKSNPIYNLGLTPDGFAIGGRNILRETASPILTSSSSHATWSEGQWVFGSGGDGASSIDVITDTPVPSVNRAFVVKNNTTGNKDYIQFKIPYQFGEAYTFSVWVKGTGTVLARAIRSGGGTITFINQAVDSPNTWVRLSSTKEITQSVSTDTISCQFGVSGACTKMMFTAPQLEKGNMVTDWKPASEDIVRDYNAKITTLNDAIISEVKASDHDNLIPYPYYESSPKAHNGITWTINSDNSIKATGTSTANSYIFITHQDGINFSLPAGDYCLTGCPNGGSDSTYRLRIFDNDNNKTLVTDYGEGATFTLTNTINHLRMYAQFPVADVKAPSNLIFYPMVTKGTTPCDYMNPALSKKSLQSQIVQTEGSITATVTQQIESAVANVQSIGLGMKVNASTFSNTNSGEIYLHGYNNKTGVAADIDGWVLWNGSKVTIPKGMLNPNSICPFNKPIYVVYRTSNSTSYFVWYDSTICRWKRSDNVSSPTITDTWTWNNETDIVLLSFIEPASEANIIGAQMYTPPLTANMVITESDIDTLDRENLITYPYYNKNNPYTANGVTVTVNNDHTIKLTANSVTANTTFKLSSDSSSSDNGWIMLNPNYTHILSGCIDGSISTYRLLCRCYPSQKGATYDSFICADKPVVIDSGYEKAYVYITVYANESKVSGTIKPMLERGSIAHSYTDPAYSTQNMYSEIKQTANEISLSVKKGTNYNGMIIDDQGAHFSGNNGSFTVDMDNLKIDKVGNVELSGDINARSFTCDGFSSTQIGSDSFDPELEGIIDDTTPLLGGEKDYISVPDTIYDGTPCITINNHGLLFYLQDKNAKTPYPYKYELGVDGFVVKSTSKDHEIELSRVQGGKTAFDSAIINKRFFIGSNKYYISQMRCGTVTMVPSSTQMELFSRLNDIPTNTTVVMVTRGAGALVYPIATTISGKTCYVIFDKTSTQTVRLNYVVFQIAWIASN